MASQSFVQVFCRFRPINKQEVETWEKSRIVNLLRQQGLQDLWPRFKQFKNRKYRKNPCQWPALAQNDKKLRVDFDFTPNDILKFQKLVAQNDENIATWLDEDRKVLENLAVELEMENQVSLCNQGRDYNFAYDRVLSWEVDQEGAFNEIALQGFLQSALEGVNGTILAYGQTGSGKTYTMFGSEPIVKCKLQDEGIVPRSFRWIFDTLADDDAVQDVKVYVEAIEVYLGKVRDLFEPTVRNKPKRLKICEALETLGAKPEKQSRRRQGRPKKKKRDKSTKTYIKIDNVFEAVATCPRELTKLIGRAWKNRTTEETAKNAVSSRSHMLFRTRLVIKKTNGSMLQSRLTFGDLAGSEKTKRSQVRGRQMKQAQDINKQLFTLRQCVMAKLEEKNRIPYADATLTKLLQHSVEGKNKLLMLFNASPHSSNLSETLSTLQFAHQCRQLKCQEIVNKHESRESLEARLARQTAEMDDLKYKLQHAKNLSIDLTASEVKALQKALEEKNNALEANELKLEATENQLKMSEDTIRSMTVSMERDASCHNRRDSLALSEYDHSRHPSVCSFNGSVDSLLFQRKCSTDMQMDDMSTDLDLMVECHTLRSMLMDVKGNMVSMETQLEEKDKEIASKDSEVQSLEDKVQTMHQRSSSLAMELGQVQFRQGSLKEEVEFLRKENHKLRAKAFSVDQVDPRILENLEFEYPEDVNMLRKQLAERDDLVQALMADKVHLQQKVVRLQVAKIRGRKRNPAALSASNIMVSSPPPNIRTKSFDLSCNRRGGSHRSASLHSLDGVNCSESGSSLPSTSDLTQALKKQQSILEGVMGMLIEEKGLSVSLDRMKSIQNLEELQQIVNDGENPPVLMKEASAQSQDPDQSDPDLEVAGLYRGEIYE